MGSSARAGAAAQLYRLLSGPSTPAGEIAPQVAGSSTAIIAGGWADLRVGDRAAALQAALPGAVPVVCTGGILRADARERAAALEDYAEYRGGPVPSAPGPSAKRLAEAIGKDAVVRVETASTNISEQGAEAANAASGLRPEADTLLVVATAYQRLGMRLAISTAAPAARVVCIDSGSDADADTKWFASHGRNLPAVMLAEAARLQSAHPEPEHASLIGQVASTAQLLDDSINSDAANLAAAVAARGVKVVCWDMDRTFMAAHSRGRMTPWLLPSFASRVSPEFIRFSEALQSTGCAQAVATHSDFAEHSPEKPEGEYIIGEPLVRAVGELCFPTLLKWPIVAYNPRARALKARAAAVDSHDATVVAAGASADDGWEGRGGSDEDRDKRYHLRTIAELVGCDVADCMLIDDMPGRRTLDVRLPCPEADLPRLGRCRERGHRQRRWRPRRPRTAA
eukprot:COSAG02_NODE_30_length_50867_cov_66.594331_50_plen_454_part_00